MARRRRPSMHDVARAAGVSQTTVSLVLNDRADSGIPPATRERVHAAAAEVGYRRNQLARAMRLSRTDTIGFVSDDIATTPYANLMIKGAQEAAWEAGRLLLIVNTGSFEHAEHRQIASEAVDQLLERQVDGIVYAAMFHRVIDPPVALDEARAVLLDAVTGENDRFPAVIPDEFDAAYRATEFLIQAGHERIGYLGSMYPSPASPARDAGFRAAMAAAGLDDSIAVAELATPAGGRAGATTLLTRADRPSALFCFNDQLAMGAYQIAGELGISIPDELSIIGVDDQALIAENLLPGLTTMALPHEQMGRWAVETLLRDEHPPAGPPLMMPCRLVERGSVTAPR